MKNIAVFIFSLLITTSIFAQQQAIKITKQTNKKEIIIKENKRIKIKTVEGEKLSGRFKIENNSILIANKQVTLAGVAEIKRNPLLVSIATSGLLIYGGTITIGFGILIGVLADKTAYLLFIPGAAMITAGILTPNFSKKYKKENISLQFITIPE